MHSDSTQNKNGQLFQQDFPDNVGGLNLVDSVFKISPNQAAEGSLNFDYVLTGGIRKRLGNEKITTVADSQTYALGFGVLAPVSGSSKDVIRAAGRRLQKLTTSDGSTASLSQDTAGASITPFASNTTQDVQFVQFSSGTNNILWGAGGGAARPVGAYSTTKFTANGAAVPTGTFTGAVNAHNSGSWSAAGAYYYALVWRKASTQALSNAGLDITKTTVNTDDTVTLTIPPPSDTTLYDQVWVYRSAIGGVSGFTTGNLIAQLASSTTSFVDKGNLGNPDILLSTLVPRSANTILDNSVLPSGTYNTLALWGNRLCTASGNSLYISEVNKSESWPLTNYITIPSAGPITALGTISYTSPQANSLFELLVVFKEKELWVLNPGANNDYTTWALLKIDSVVGCPQQSLLVNAQGFLAWIDYRGVWLWDGTSKPIYTSRLLEPLFGTDGDLDKSQFAESCGAFFRRENQISWFLSSKTYGVQKFCIKMDMRLTLMQVQQNLTGRTMDAVLMTDVHAFPIYAAMTYLPLSASDEQMLLGDNAGFSYFAANDQSDGGDNYLFRYRTAPLHCGDPNTNKQFYKVIAWVKGVGDWDLSLDYWTNYNTSSSTMATTALPVSPNSGTQALWESATWDTSSWGDVTIVVRPLVFHLQPGNANSNQGSSLQIQFRNDNANEPITIHGFSVVYGVLGGIT